MRVKKRNNLGLKKPLMIARKFKISLENVRDLQRGEILDLDDALARNLKQWGMVSYVDPQESKTSDNEPEPEKTNEDTVTTESKTTELPEPVVTQETIEDVSRETITESEQQDGTELDVQGVELSPDEEKVGKINLERPATKGKSKKAKAKKGGE